MLATLLLTLAATPSAAALADSGAARGMLVRVDDVAAAAADPLQPQIPLSQMTRSQLRAEYRRIEDSRPPLVGQILAVVFGGVAIGAGVIVCWGALLSGILSSVPITPIIIGIGLAIGGGALLTFGIVMLRMANAERAPYNEAMQEIQDRIDGKFEEAPPPRYEPVVPPPPPPPPPGAGFSIPPSIVLARF